MSAVFSKRRQIFRGRRSVVPRNAAAPGIFVYRRWMPPEKRARARLQGRAQSSAAKRIGEFGKVRRLIKCAGRAIAIRAMLLARLHRRTRKTARRPPPASGVCPTGADRPRPSRRKRPSNACRDAFRGNDFHHFQCPTSAFPLRAASYPRIKARRIQQCPALHRLPCFHP